MEFFNIDVVREYGGALLHGLLLTVVLTLIVIVLALVLAIPVALCRLSSYRVVRGVSSFYVEVIRGTPPFVVMLLSVSVLLIFFPQIALFLRDLSIDG